jgi:hypothetical protein
MVDTPDGSTKELPSQTALRPATGRACPIAGTTGSAVPAHAHGHRRAVGICSVVILTATVLTLGLPAGAHALRGSPTLAAATPKRQSVQSQQAHYIDAPLPITATTTPAPPPTSTTTIPTVATPVPVPETAATTPAPAATVPAPTGEPPVAELVTEVEAAGIEPGPTWSWTMGDTATQCGVIPGNAAGTGCTSGAAGAAKTVFEGVPSLPLVAHELADAETENDAVPSLMAEVASAEAGTAWSPIDAVASCLVEHFMGFQDGAAGSWQCPTALATSVAADI